MSVILTAQHLRVEFGAIVAVHDVSFDLSGGQLLGLVGPNGAGKTTLLRVLAGLQVPTRGTAHILGRPVLGGHEIVRHHVGFAPDSAPAYEELTIYQFLRFIARAYSLSSDTSEERIDFWLEQLWLEGKRHTPIKNLSRGMRQRVTLARAFLPQPHVILLDEPLAGLDPAGRIELRGVLGMLRDQGCAMIVSSHILADLEQVATHIAIIERGSFLRWSTTEALFHHDEKQRVYRVSVVEGYTGTSEVLEVIEGVTKVSSNGRTVEFEYTADEQKAAELLQTLIARDVPVVSFTVVKASLEEAYLRAGVRQVD